MNKNLKALKKVNDTNFDSNLMPSLKYQKTDFMAQLSRSGLGAIPLVGSLLSEISSTLIPNQRFDRLVAFAEKLEHKISKLDKEFVKSQLKNEVFVGVLEEGCIQSAKSTSDERREYISSIISNGLSKEEVEFNNTRYFLKLLAELNDTEIIILRSYLVRTIGGDEVFREKHKNVIHQMPVTMGSSQKDKDDEAIYKNYIKNLVSLGFLEEEYHADIQSDIPDFDKFTHGLKVQGHHLTSMGKLFLIQIGLAENNQEYY